MIPHAAMVLAAGLGTRMRPVSDAMPKALVPVCGTPLIDRVLDRLDEAGVEMAVVNIHHHAEALAAHLKFRTRPRIVLSDERAALLDTGGGVRKALPLLGADPFFVQNADSIWIEGARSCLARMAREFDPARMDALLMLAPVVAASGYKGLGDFALSPDGRVARRRDNVPVPFVFAGVSLAHPRLFESAPDGPFSINVLWDRALDVGRLYGIRHDGIWMHVGTPTAIEEAERWLKGDVP